MAALRRITRAAPKMSHLLWRVAGHSHVLSSDSFTLGRRSVRRDLCANTAALSEKAVRESKLEQLRSSGWEFAVRPSGGRTHQNQELRASFASLKDGETSATIIPAIVICGRVMAARWFGKLAFITVQDASGRLQLQLSAHGTNGAKGMAVDNAVASARKTIDIGDIVCATGTAMKRTNKGEVSLVVENLELLTKAVRPLPEKYHGLVDVEKRYRHRALDLIMNERSRMILRLRSAVMSQTRQFLERRNFSEMETPMLHQRAGGAAARPFTTKHHALGCNFQLRIATELHLKQLLVGGFEKIFELGRVLRNEGISQRHNPEFTSLEVYEAYADYTDMAELLENLVSSVALAVCGATLVPYQETTIELAPPWRRASMAELVHEQTGISFVTTHGVPLDRDAAVALAMVPLSGAIGGRATTLLVACETAGGVMNVLFEQFVESELWAPTIVTDYPTEISPLARMHRDPEVSASVQGGLTERFEAFVAGRELANAFSELTDPHEQRRRFEQQLSRWKELGDPEAQLIDEEFLRALEQGMPPSGGLGIGMDRLVMLLADAASIREVIAFPTLRPAKPTLAADIG